MIKAKATIQLTTMELVIGKLKGRASSTAFAERPCSSWGATVSGPACGADIAEATCDFASTAQLKLALRQVNPAIRRTANTPHRWWSAILIDLPVCQCDRRKELAFTSFLIAKQSEVQSAIKKLV